MKIAVLSDGAWATAIASLLVSNQHAVTIWGPFPENIERMRKTGKNDRFLKGHELPKELALTNSMTEAVDGVDLIVLASPTQFARITVEKLAQVRYKNEGVVVNVAKGIEVTSLKRVSQICQEVLGSVRYGVLSGPSHAEEVAHGVPTAVVVASSSANISIKIQNIFMNEVFRVYTSDDVVGVELGGALKNVFAIAAGACDGMGLGDNSKAALITRGVAEMARLGLALGGRQETFSGLSGLGDMIVTCCSQFSRNRYVGEGLGKGKQLESLIKEMGRVVAEGVSTTKSAYALAKSKQVDTPIINEIYAALYQGKDLRKGVEDLMTRKAKNERG